MKVKTISPLLLFLLPSLAASLSTPLDHDRLALRKREPAPELLEVPKRDPIPNEATTARSAPTVRPYKGTEDAPVDGLDGKPHAGPFVDTKPEESRAREDGARITTTEKARPTSLEKFAAGSDDRWRLENIPDRNDGVMNDENRVLPKKGTTGTEGGISEKAKERQANPNAENKPQEPKVAPQLPQEEQERLDAQKSKQNVPILDGDKKATSERTSYGGLEKPADLPGQPRAVPAADQQVTRSDNKAGGPPVQPPKALYTDTMPYTEGEYPPDKPPGSSRSFVHALPSNDDHETWHELFHSFGLSLTMILFSEIGDKTFLVAALMAMRHSQLLVFSAAFTALIIMTILSAILGHTLPALLPKRLTTLAAALLFLVFGAKMLREGLAMPVDLGVGEEMKEVEAELEEKEHSMALDRSRRHSSSPQDLSSLESGRGRPFRHHSNSTKLPGSELSPPSSRSRSRSPSPNTPRKTPSGGLSGLLNLCTLVLGPAWVQTFIMTFLGEWGDRSQIATIAMAAGQDYWWVTLGAVTGHAFCTGLAVVGGRALAGRVSLRIGESAFPP